MNDHVPPDPPPQTTMYTPPPKKARLSPELPSASATSILTAIPQSAAEIAVGITEYVNPTLPAWSGVLKQRYTDFLVNEVDQEGRVVHLSSTKAPQVGRGEEGRRGDRKRETVNAKPGAATMEVKAAEEVGRLSSWFCGAGY